MQCIFKSLLQTFCVVKKYLEMQHAWFMHTNFYVQGKEADDINGLGNDTKVMSQDAWKAVIDLAKVSGGAISIEDQRIIIGTMAQNIVFDLMCTEIKEFKKEKEMSEHDQTVADSVLDEERHSESTVVLCRYAGAALYSMIQKRLKLKLSKDHPEVKYLNQMKHDNFDEPVNVGDECTKENTAEVGNHTGFVSISPALLPFVKQLMAVINEHSYTAK